MDEEEAKEKQEEEQAGQKTAHVAGKAAATYFGGPAGTKIYDIASRTKAGQAIENSAGKLINSSPVAKNLTKKLDKSHALDVADKGLDMASGDAQGATEGLSKETLAKEGLQREGLEDVSKQADHLAHLQAAKQSNENSSKDKDSSSANGEATGEKNEENKWIKPFLSLMSVPFTGCGCFLLIIIAIIGILLIPAMSILRYFNGDYEGNEIGNKATEKAEREYYETLKQAQDNAYQKYHVCIDVNLIHATLIVDKAFNNGLDEGEELCDDPDTCSEEAKDILTAGDYRKMEKYVDVLANMQIKRKKYGLYKEDKPNCYESSYEDICADGEESKEIIVTDENVAKECMDVSLWDQWFSDIPLRNSEDLRLVARNDKESTLFNFFTKRANREKNYAYYYYIPAATFKDEDGDGTKETRVCDPSTPKSNTDFAELSIGDWENMEDGVYYWNLLDSFVEDYYSEYLTKEVGYAEEGTKRFEAANKLIDNIYDLYTIMGPSRDCTELYSYQTASNFCPDGVTVVGKDEGTYDLEEYIAGVVEAEMYADFGMESKKALAVAARSYVLASTNQCEQAIDNSSNAQNFNPNYSAESWEAANSTRGEVITADGKVILAQYDSWDCPGKTSCQYTKLPSGEKHTVTISNRYLGRAAGGHGRGMSQIAAADMAADGSNYHEILNYFYTGSLTISSGGSGGAVKDGSLSEKLAFLFPDGLPTSSSEMQKYLTTVSVPLVDINGNARTGKLTVHQAIASDVVNIYTEIANAGFPIKDTYCYSWRGMAGNRQSTSHHSYGVACDINANENYMIRNGRVIAGSFWKPGENPYSIEPNGPVVQAFNKYGWVWGGNWSSSKDYMHFSFTGH